MGNKNTKSSHKPTATMKEDRISELPDEILQHIISSLSPKEAVQTSILSKRWNNLWSSLPNLRFDFTRLAIENHAGLFGKKSFMPRFEHFVTNFLSHRDNTSRVHEFQLLSTKNGTDSGFIEKCVDYAINHGVQRLHIDCYCSSTPFKFPDGFLAIKTLRVLRIKQYSTGGRVVVPKPFVLSNLKTLYLEGFEFNDDGDDLYSLPKEPFSGFLDLEELTLYDCEVSDLIISAQKLKFLEISFDLMTDLVETKMERISAPMLTSFRHKGPVSLVCAEIDCPCLEEVYFDRYSEGVEEKPVNLARMLQQLGNARFLTLSIETIWALAREPWLVEQSPSPFPNIKCLNILGRSQQMMEDVLNYLTKESLIKKPNPWNWIRSPQATQKIKEAIQMASGLH